MADTVDKIIVSNRSALLKKYTRKELALIEAAIDDLIAADHGRGVVSKVFFLDDKAIREYGARPVRGIRDARGNKDAIDALYNWFSPDYVLILGSQDVIPHIKVTNQTRDEDGRIIDSDLPYACDRPFSRNARHFLAPTRVVGRLPDVNGRGNPAYLIGLLKNAASAERRSKEDYAGWFALSTQSWTGSSAITAANLFSSLEGLALCPPTRPDEHKSLHRARVHFFNCHGGAGAHLFWGEEGDAQPVSFRSSSVPVLLPGTFVAAECCYGAELYAPGNGQLSISARYLQNNAAAYVGSTTIAYGPEEGQGSADLITQYFVRFVLRGHSVGRAFLEARQKFLDDSGPRIDSVELKTLCQFLLLGDPSLHLVDKLHRSLVIDHGELLVESKDREKFFRKERRKQLLDRGEAVGQKVDAPQPAGLKIPAGRHRRFSMLARENGLQRFKTSASRFESQADGEVHYTYVETRSRKHPRRTPRIIIFKETGRQVDVKVYKPK
jgi:hypothetical protein